MSINRKQLIRLLGVVFLALPLSLPSEAQQHLRPSAPDKTLTGVVSSTGGKPMSGVHVLLQKSNGGVTRSYITDNAGHYRFKHLTSTVDYEVWARYKRRNSSKSRISRFDADPNPTANLTVSAP